MEGKVFGEKIFTIKNQTIRQKIFSSKPEGLDLAWAGRWLYLALAVLRLRAGFFGVVVGVLVDRLIQQVPPFSAVLVTASVAANSALKNFGRAGGQWDFLMGCLSASAWVGVCWRAAIYT